MSIYIWVMCLNCGFVLPSLWLFLCHFLCLSLSISLHSQSVSSGNSKLDQPIWSHCFFSTGSFAGQHLIPDTSCSPTAWLIWPCQMARDHQFWRSPLWINWTLSRSKASLINPICLHKVHIPPAGEHSDPVRKSALISMSQVSNFCN